MVRYLEVPFHPNPHRALEPTALYCENDTLVVVALSLTSTPCKLPAVREYVHALRSSGGPCYGPNKHF